MRIYQLSPAEIRQLAQDLADAQSLGLTFRVAIQGDAGPIFKTAEGMWTAPMGALEKGTEQCDVCGGDPTQGDHSHPRFRGQKA